MSLWGGRFTGNSSDLFKQVNDSLPFDCIMAKEDITGSICWSRALRNAQVLTASEQHDIETALQELLRKVEQGAIDFSASDEEDIHSFVEAYLIEKLGAIGKKLHTGRSRNDQVATDLRLWCKTQTASLLMLHKHMSKALLVSAEQYKGVIMPGYTHLQRAQPIRYPHWCLAYIEMLKRDISRLEDACQRMDQSPLGVGALAGTTYPVDRQAIAAELGFASSCLNSLDAVSDRDFVLELLFCASTGMMHLSRLAEDLIFFNSGEAGFISLGDKVTSGSSLMPQKKNPDALELMRGKCGRVFGHLQGLLVTLKGLPLAYNKDMQEDKQGLFDALEQWRVCLSLGAEVVSSMQINVERCHLAAQHGYANATELADYLVGKGIAFRQAHDISGRIVLYALEQKRAIEDLPLSALQQYSEAIEADVYAVLQLEQLLEKRNVLGGTALARVEQALEREHRRLS